MPQFTVTIPGTFDEPLTEDRGRTFQDSLNRYFKAAYVRSLPQGAFEVVMEVGAETQNLAESLARLVTVCALFDSGYSIATSSVDEAGITSRPS